MRPWAPPCHVAGATRLRPRPATMTGDRPAEPTPGEPRRRVRPPSPPPTRRRRPRRAPARPPAVGSLSRGRGRGGRRRTPPTTGRRRSRAASPSRSRSRSLGAVAIVVLGGVADGDAGLVVVAGGDGWASALALRFGAGRHLPRGRRVGHRRRARARAVALGQARPVAVRPDRGRRPAAARLPRPRCSGRSSRPVRRGGGRRLARSRDERRRSGYRRPVEADHATLVGQIDDWWGGRKVHAAPAAPVVPALHRDVVGRRGRRRAGSVGFLVGFISPDRPDEAYIHMIGTSPNHRRPGSAGRCTSGSSRTSRARGVRRVTRRHLAGQPRSRSAFHRAMGFEPADGPGTQNLYGTPGLPRLRRRRRRPGRVQPGDCDRRPA